MSEMNSLAKNNLTPAWMALSMSSFWEAKVVAPAGRQHTRASCFVKDERRDVGEEKSVVMVWIVVLSLLLLSEGEVVSGGGV